MHAHHFEPRNGAACVLEDRIDYALPLGKLGRAVAGAWMARTLRRTFHYRHTTLANDLERHNSAPREPRTIVVSGASGLIGRALCAFLSTGGHRVKRLVRHVARGADEIFWDPRAGRIDDRALAADDVDAVVHLAGAGVADARWTAARKRELRDSRVHGTSLLASALARLERKPAVMVSASAVGYYGTRDREVDESSAPGADFLADVCVEWEAAADVARAAGIRVAHPRLGVVLTPAGGALATMLPPFKVGLGATPGDGRNPAPWVALDDVLGALHFAIFHPTLDGAFDVVAPDTVTMGELTHALGRTLGHPPHLRAPAAAIELALGEMASTVLGGARLHPRRLVAAGFHFAHPTLPAALAHLLGADAASH
ncbi:MAG TPA: TIGR01777 family oxidoreductase [Polyangia bacterium]|nr:TIGR01777 family oxidoreductase [Polyangia bacterium]